MGDLPKNGKKKEGSSCNGWPTQIKKNMENGRIVMGDPPKMEKRKSGRVVMGDLPRWRNGLIVMGDWPR